MWQRIVVAEAGLVSVPSSQWVVEPVSWKVMGLILRTQYRSRRYLPDVLTLEEGVLKSLHGKQLS